MRLYKTSLIYFLFLILACSCHIISPVSACIHESQKHLIFEKIVPQGNTTFGIIEDIQQDSSGFIWIAAKDGLFRYDGIVFKSYISDRKYNRSISNNVITDLFCDSKGRLWIGTENGLNLYNEEYDHFTRFISNPNDSTTISANHIVRMTEDFSGQLWIATADRGISVYDDRKKTFTRFTVDHRNGMPIIADFLRTIFIDSEGIIWVGTVDKGAFCYKPGADNLPSIISGPSDGKHLAGYDVRCIAEYPAGKIWFGTNDRGLTCFEKKTGQFVYYTASQRNSISSDAIWNFFVDSRQNLWICTDGGGLNKFNSVRNCFETYRNVKKDNNSISSNVVRVFYEDDAGNYWIGNFNAPLNYIDTHKKKFNLIRFSDEDEIEQGINNIISVLRDKEETLWIGTDGNGLLIVNENGDVIRKFRHIEGNINSIANNKPLCLEEDDRGNIWIGTFEGGLSCFNPHSNRFTNFYPDGTTKNPRGTQIWDLLFDHGKLWIASERGVDVLNTSTMIFNPVPIDKKKGTGTNVAGSWKIVKDSKNRILIGTIFGLNVFDPAENRFYYYEPNLDNTTSISDKWILSIYEDRHHRIWIGTNGGGLNLWIEPDKFICFNTKDGLPGNVINDILEDSEGLLWLSTNNGLASFDYDSLKITIFDKKDGIQDNRFNINAAYKDRDGTLYFGGVNGLTYFNPNEITNNTKAPRVVLTGFDLFNRPVDITDPKSPVKKNIICTEEIHLNHKQMVFTLHFAALNYTQPDENRYKYKLEGFEEEWNIVGNQHWATYTNLKAGKYTFHVLGSNNDNSWSPEGAKITIVIHPPFYRTVWFILCLILSGILIIFGIYRFRVREMRMINKKLSLLVAERTVELEKRNEEISNQNEEIKKQINIATAQRDQISAQNEELEKHRNRLEELVKERTADLAAAKEKAEDSDRLKTAFLENISHQIRTPMNAIIGFINLLSDKIDDKNSREYYLRIINDSGRSMLRLVEDIIDFSRMQTRQLQPEYAECDVQRLIKDLISSIRMKASREKPELNITMDLPASETIIVTDERKLTQILMKLLENSYKHTEKGHIRVSIKTEEDRFTCFVEDTGKQIEEKYLDKIFDHLFFVSEFDSNRSARGSGIGLAFAKTVTELLGGKIWAETSSPDINRFIFSLPLTNSLERQNIKRKSSDKVKYSWKDKIIVVAEDEDSNYQLIEAMLKDTGAKLIRATDGVHLLEVVEHESNIDLVLLDIQMPRMNGISAIKIIRESNRKIPVIAQTAYDHTQHRDVCREQGFAGYIVKPIRKSELLESIDQCFKKFDANK